MKTNPILIAATTLTLAVPAVLQSAHSDPGKPQVADKPEPPRAGLVTIVDVGARNDQGDSKRRIAWKSLAALPAGERERLVELVRTLDRANPPRAPRLAAPACMD